MTPDQALYLCRLAKSLSPAQAVDEFTPEAWGLVLADVSFEDSKTALIQLAKEQEFIHVSHIAKRVSKIRGDRITAYGVIDLPREVQDGQRDYQEWYVTTRTAIADGRLVRTGPALKESGDPHPSVMKQIRGAFRDATADYCVHNVPRDKCRASHAAYAPPPTDSEESAE